MPRIISGWNWDLHAIQMLKWCWNSHNWAQGKKGKRLHRRKFYTTVYNVGSVFITSLPWHCRNVSCEWLRKIPCAPGPVKDIGNLSFLWLWESFGLSPYYKSKLYGLIEKTRGMGIQRTETQGFWYLGRLWKGIPYLQNLVSGLSVANTVISGFAWGMWILHPATHTAPVSIMRTVHILNHRERLEQEKVCPHGKVT